MTGNTGNFLFNDPAVTQENYFTVHADDKLSGKDDLAGTYFLDIGTITSPDPFDVVNTGNAARPQMATISAHKSIHLLPTVLCGTIRFI